MWEIQINWKGRWITVQGGFKSRGDAEWATGLWKQENHCTGDPFRAMQSGTGRSSPHRRVSSLPCQRVQTEHTVITGAAKNTRGRAFS